MNPLDPGLTAARRISVNTLAANILALTTLATTAVGALTLAADARAQQTPQAQDPSAQRARVMTRVRTHLARRQPAQAVALLQKWLAKNTKDAQARHMLGGALLASGKVDEALEQCRLSLEHPTYRTGALYNLARIHAKKGAKDRSLSRLKEARDAGFIDRARMLADAEFASFRKESGFQKLLPALRRGKELFVEDVKIVHDILGEAPGDQFGWVARRLGDVDGDGVIDFVTSAPTKVIDGKQAAGRVYAYSSKTGKVLWIADGTAGARLGTGLAGCGDVDGDGIPDAIVGAPGAARAFVYSGKNGEVLVELKGPANVGFGTKACGLEDIDGDGRPELCVGAPSGDVVHIYDHSGKPRFKIEAPTSAKAGQFGTSLDGYIASTCGLESTAASTRMLVIGAPRAQQTGRAYAYKISSEGPKLAFEIKGDATSRNLGQYFVAMLRDCDGDGVEDVFASDWLNAGAAPSAGRVFVHSGKTGKLLLTLSGKQGGEGFGTSMSQAGDVDGDGASDLIIGAWQNRAGARSGGRCSLYSGRDGKLLATYTCRQHGDTFGFDAQGIGDVDGDGAVDFLCTSAWSPVHGTNTGRVVIVAGPKFEKRD